jgi:hypothetical protein
MYCQAAIAAADVPREMLQSADPGPRGGGLNRPAAALDRPGVAGPGYRRDLVQCLRSFLGR